jgi:DNA repair exonuclease SbcCD ATPase subunit
MQLEKKNIKINDLIKDGEEKAEVEVSFNLKKKNYSVKRIIERDKGTTYSEIRENGNLIEAPSSVRVTEKVMQSLNLEGAPSIYLPIFYLDLSSLITPEERELINFLQFGKILEEKEENMACKESLLSNLGMLKECKEKIFEKTQGIKCPFIEKIMEDVRMEIERLHEEIMKKTHIIHVLSEVEKERWRTFLENMNKKLKEIWEIFYPYASFQIELKSDLNLIGKDESGNLIDFEHMSGGERTLVSLAFKMALFSVLLPNLKILILGESFNYFDIIGKEKFLDILQKVKEFFDQVVILTQERVEIENFVELG